MNGWPISRIIWLICGIVAVALGVIGIALPILPTVPFLILAAFCFARSHPAWEARLMNHPVYGPTLTAWREKGIVGRRAKWAATGAFAASIVFGLFTLSGYWLFVPPVVAIICCTWLWRRPEA
jgi:uncharacterized protein